MAKTLDTKIELARFYDKKGLQQMVTIDDYNTFVNNQDKVAIADFLYNRLHSRYIKPFQFNDNDGKFAKEYKNGFSIMANCCLLIETLQSFKNGWGDSHNKSEQAFKQFLSSDKHFQELKTKGKEFFVNVRCGILHQGETTNGWKLNRAGKKLFDDKKLIIDSITFMNRLEDSLETYSQELKKAEWDSETWDNFRTKMRKLILNCEKEN